MDDDDKRHITVLIGGLYADGYADGMASIAGSLDIEGAAVEQAGTLFPEAFSGRRKLIADALSSYAGLIREKAKALKEERLSNNEIKTRLYDYAHTLADQKASLITHTEYATGQNQGAKAVLDAADWDYEIQFPHMELGRPGHEECDVCVEIREGAPYTREQAEEFGYPDLPHLNCDHAFIVVPKGQISRTEEFPPQ